MRLYTFYTPNCLKIHMALAELGVDCERKPISLAKREQMGEEFKRINPHRKVPVLEVEGKAIAESGAILQYLGRAASGTLWPLDAIEDARLARWLFFESVHLAPYCGPIWWSDVLAPRRRVEPASEARLELAVSDLARALDVLHEEFETRDHLAETGFTLADCALGATLSMLKDTRVDLAERWPNVDLYGARVRARRSWREGEGDRCMHWVD